jgi:hypothetical protein
MKKYDGYAETEAITGDYEVIEPGAYICKIKEVECVGKDYGELLNIKFDIVDGKYKDFYQKKFDELGKWFGMYYQTVLTDNLKFFKAFITAIEKSNQGFEWEKSWDEKQLVGKFFGGVFAEEEYLSNKGDLRISCKCVQVRSVEQVKQGKVKIPPLKKLANNNQGYVPVTNEFPF